MLQVQALHENGRGRTSHVLELGAKQATLVDQGGPVSL